MGQDSMGIIFEQLLKKARVWGIIFEQLLKKEV